MWCNINDNPPPHDWLRHLPPDQWHGRRNQQLSLALKQIRGPELYPVANPIDLPTDPTAFNQCLEKLPSTLSKPERIALGLVPLESEDRLSVVVPIYNESSTARQIIHRLAQVPVVSQIIAVDDGSSDQSGQILATIEKEACDWDSDSSEARAASVHPLSRSNLPDGLVVVSHLQNRGKGAAIRTGFEKTVCPWVAVQDADLEYDPQDLSRLHAIAKRQQATIVYGNRFFRTHKQASNPEGDDEVNDAISPTWHQWGNHLISRLSGWRCGAKLNDVETCQKLIRRSLLTEVLPELKENRFGIEIEMTIKLARLKTALFEECPISYDRRGYAEGKKIGWQDAVRALYCLIAYR